MLQYARTPGTQYRQPSQAESHEEIAAILRETLGKCYTAVDAAIVQGRQNKALKSIVAAALFDADDRIYRHTNGLPKLVQRTQEVVPDLDIAGEKESAT